MFSIYDGREKLYQWDKDIKLLVKDETIKEVHFANCLCPSAKVCEVYAENGLRLVDVPNELLTDYTDIRVWGFDGAATKYEAVFEVERKPKPDDYIYTPTDIYTVEKAVEEALEAAKESGEFKGDKGDKGEAGVINFVVVSELPTEGSGDSIYLLPNTTGENNNFDEFIFTNGAWEKIGSAGVEINLDEFVKKTDYAADGKPGLVSVGYTTQGLYTTGSDARLAIYGATKEKINAKNSRNLPIVTDVLDYAVKVGVTTNTEALTEEEKTAACEWMGAVERIADATGSERTQVYTNKLSNVTGKYTVQVDGYHTATNWAIPVRNSKGGIYIPDNAVNDDGAIPTGCLAVNRNYVDNGFLAKPAKYPALAGCYAWNSDTGETQVVRYSPNAEQWSLAYRGNNGSLMVGTPTENGHAATKQYVDNLIAELTARIEALEGVK